MKFIKSIFISALTLIVWICNHKKPTPVKPVSELHLPDMEVIFEDRPFDLGYTFGYIISKSYYENHSNKKQVIYDFLNTDDYTKIYQHSDYAFLLD